MPVYVKMIESAANTERSWQTGDLFECESEEIAAELIEAKVAVPADVQPAQGVEQPKAEEVEQPKAADEETKKAQPKATKSKGA